MDIRFEQITYDNIKAVVQLYDTLTDQQKKAVAPNINSLAEAYLNYNTAWPRAIYDQDKLIGFLMLGLDNFIADEKDFPVYFLWRLMIAQPFQNQGYGKKIIDKVISKCRREGINYLYVSCDRSVDMPYAFYTKYGFIDTGRVEDDETILKIKV